MKKRKTDDRKEEGVGPCINYERGLEDKIKKKVNKEYMGARAEHTDRNRVFAEIICTHSLKIEANKSELYTDRL